MIRKMSDWSKSKQTNSKPNQNIKNVIVPPKSTRDIGDFIQ